MGPEQPIDPQGDPLVQELVADDDEVGGQEETARGKPDFPRGGHAVHSRPLRSAVVFRGRINLLDMIDPSTPRAASLGDLSSAVYSPWDGNPSETHAHDHTD
jgi:hypothetical protein